MSESCFNCDSLSNGWFRPHPPDNAPVRWIGLTQDGQAHYACDDCKDLLFDAALLEGNAMSTSGEEKVDGQAADDHA